MDDKMLYKMQADIETLKKLVDVQGDINNGFVATIENIYRKDIGELKVAIAQPHERLARIEKAIEAVTSENIKKFEASIEHHQRLMAIEKALAKLLDWHNAYEDGLTDKAFYPLQDALRAVVDGRPNVE